MERRETEMDRDPGTGTGQVQEQRVVSEPGAAPAQSEVVNTFNPGWRATQLVYLVFGVIDGLLLIRLVLKLLGANPLAGFATFVYNASDFFLVPFKNLLPTIGNEHSMLEMSLVVAILVYALIGWAIGRLVEVIFYRNVTVARRSSGLRPRGF